MSCAAMSGSRDGCAAAAASGRRGGGCGRGRGACGSSSFSMSSWAKGWSSLPPVGACAAGDALAGAAGSFGLAEEPLDLVLAHQGIVFRHRNPFLERGLRIDLRLAQFSSDE